MDELFSVAVYDGDHVTLEVGDVVEFVTVIDKVQRRTGGIVGEIHGMPVHGHVGQLVTVVGVVVNAIADRCTGVWVSDGFDSLGA